MPRLSSLVLKTLAGLGITLPAGGGINWGSTLNVTRTAVYAAPDAGSETNYEFGTAGLACTDNHTIVGRITSSSPTSNWQRYGAAYIFDNNTGELLYSHTPTLPGDQYTNTKFGTVVGISDTHYAVLQYNRLYVYDLATGLLLWNVSISGSGISTHRISIVGTYIILGVYYTGILIYDIATGNAVTPPSLPAGYTNHVDVGRSTYATEDYLVFGSRGSNFNTGPGAVHIYRMEAGFPYVGTVVNPTTNPQSYFGWRQEWPAIAVSAMSNRIAISNPEEQIGGNPVGRIYVYALDTQTLLYTIESPGAHISYRWPQNLFVTDSHLFAGWTTSQIHIYDISTGQLVTILNGLANYNFGTQISVSPHRLVSNGSFDSTSTPRKVDLFNLYDIL